MTSDNWRLVICLSFVLVVFITIVIAIVLLILSHNKTNRLKYSEDKQTERIRKIVNASAQSYNGNPNGKVIPIISFDKILEKQVTKDCFENISRETSPLKEEEVTQSVTKFILDLIEIIGGLIKK